MIDANKLREEKKKRDELKYITFKSILKTLNNKILIASHGNNSQCIYQVPQFLFGHPTYKLSECIEYLEKKLKSNNYDIVFYEPNVLVISWN